MAGIEISVNVTGATVGHELGGNPEELAYALEELTSWEPEALGADIVAYGPYGSTDAIAEWLVSLAHAIEQAPSA